MKISVGWISGRRGWGGCPERADDVPLFLPLSFEVSLFILNERVITPTPKFPNSLKTMESSIHRWIIEKTRGTPSWAQVIPTKEQTTSLGSIFIPIQTNIREAYSDDEYLGSKSSSTWRRVELIKLNIEPLSSLNIHVSWIQLRRWKYKRDLGP